MARAQVNVNGWQTNGALVVALFVVGSVAVQRSHAQQSTEERPAESAHARDVPSMAAPGRLWEVSFPKQISLEEYAKRMDFFGVEVAAVSKSGKVEYIAQLSERKPERRVGRRDEDDRLAIGWKSGTLHAIDRKLLRNAGIASATKELLHFFPEQTQSLMAQVERAYAKRDPRTIRRTRFEIRPLEAGGYEFVVVEQDPPKDEERATTTLLRVEED